MRIIYDIEIKKAIADPKNRIHGIEYCDGWHDHAGMGISCIAAMDMETKRSYMFMDDNMPEFGQLASRADLLLGFNNIAFDNPVIRANEIMMQDIKCYDLLVEIWRAAEGVTTWAGSKTAGYGLDDMFEALTGKRGKIGHGAHAPVDWQNKMYGNLTNYCLNDIWMTFHLLEFVEKFGYLTNPKGGNPISIKYPKYPSKMEK